MDKSTGTVIDGRYEILQKIGQGGFGETFLARNRELDKKVVIKIAFSADPNGAARIRTEQRLLACISSPHIVSMLDSGTLEDGRPFTVTEWVEGSSLDQILKEQTLTLDHALETAYAITSGLAAAHEKGIIHRDLKPANVLIPKRGEQLLYAEAKILDFGALGELEKDSNLTQAGQVFGTPYYMSPEQIRGQAQNPATDFYGVGILLYEMIYGRTPFSGDGSEDGLQLIQRLLKEAVAFPSSPAIPRDVKELIRRCLTKEPERRPQSASQLLSELDDLLTRQLPPPSQTSISTTSRPITRNVLIGSAAILTIVLTVLLAIIGSPSTLGLAIGVVLIGLGVSLGSLVRKAIRRHKPKLEWDANKLLAQARTTGRIDQSLATQVEELIAKCQSVDQRLLGLTMAGMVGEYHAAKESNNRQDALMNLVQLLEKLMKSLSPWYVRQEKLIAFIVTTLGIVSGIVSIMASVIKMIEPGK